jgi:hypothetical protein
MVETSRLKIILLLIAMAQLGTEVTRLVSELIPSHSRHTRIEERMKPGRPDAHGSESGATREDPGTKGMKPSDPSGARGPPPDSRGYRTAPFSRYYPGCRDCRQSAWRCERRYDAWYCEWYDE